MRLQNGPAFSAHEVTKVYRMGEVEVHALRGVDLELIEPDRPRGCPRELLPDIALSESRQTDGQSKPKPAEVSKLV